MYSCGLFSSLCSVINENALQHQSVIQWKRNQKQKPYCVGIFSAGSIPNDGCKFCSLLTQLYVMKFHCCKFIIIITIINTQVISIVHFRQMSGALFIRGIIWIFLNDHHKSMIMNLQRPRSICYHLLYSLFYERKMQVRFHMPELKWMKALDFATRLAPNKFCHLNASLEKMNKYNVKSIFSVSSTLSAPSTYQVSIP